MNTSSKRALDRKSTRLNSSHYNISYAVFCLKKKNAHHRAAGNVVDDHRDLGILVDRLVMLVQPFLRRLMLIGRHMQRGIGTRLLFFLMKGDPRRSTLFPSTALFR